MTQNADHPMLAAIRPEAREAPESGIVEVFNYGRGRPGLIPMWAGEGDLPTPDFIYEAAVRSLRDGETFYTAQRGIPEVRAALARYHERTYGRAFGDERFFITGGGMQAIQIAARMVAGHGDEVLVPIPAWPNITAAIAINGGVPVGVPLRFGNDGWRLDLDRLFDAATERTRGIFLNSPSNPTGWTAKHDELVAILDFARARGLFIIADEVYHRFYFAGPRAPSLHDVAGAEDRVIHVNTFSKNWSMTGWRIGWLSTTPALGQTIENLIQYSTSGVATFMQRAAVAALDDGDDFLAMQVERVGRSREIVSGGLAATGRARVHAPDGAFYLFFGVDGEDDTRALAKRIVDEANVGLAPGSAFGPAGEGYMRLCFAARPEIVAEATDRLVAWLRRG
jgi:aspartate/methionine/tyrosine aminotransferase